MMGIGDGSVTFMAQNMDLKVHRGLGTRNKGQVVNVQQ